MPRITDSVKPWVRRAVDDHSHRRAFALAAPPVAGTIPHDDVRPTALHAHHVVPLFHQDLSGDDQGSVVGDRVLFGTTTTRHQQGDCRGNHCHSHVSLPLCFHFSNSFAI